MHKSFIKNITAPKMIYYEYEKRNILSDMGVNYYYLKNFDSQFANISDEMFLNQLCSCFNIKHITVGFDFRFGKNAEGNTHILIGNAEKYGYDVTIIPKFAIDGKKVSSSAIRQYIAEGNIEKAANYLGRPLCMELGEPENIIKRDA